jgi:hypothetical protein
MRPFLVKLAMPTVGVVLGELLGWAYWHWVGCSSGSCPITSNPFNSTLYGAAMGGLFFSSFSKK